MIDLHAAWLAGLGLGELRELAVLRAEHSARTFRAVRRLTIRGQAAPDVPRARLGIAIARETRRQLDLAGPFAVALVVFVILVASGLSVGAFRDGRIVLGGLHAAFVLLTVRRLLSRGRVRRRMADSERRNTELLAAAGEHYVPAGSGIAEPDTAERLLGCVIAVAYFSAVFGLMRQWIHDDPIALTGVIE